MTMAAPSSIRRRSTAPGLSGIGHNELIVGKALKDVRENVVIATKLMLHGFSFGSVYQTIR